MHSSAGVKSDGVARHVAKSRSQRDCFGEDDKDVLFCEDSSQVNAEEEERCKEAVFVQKLTVCDVAHLDDLMQLNNSLR